ncbi:MAG: hypothetical protein QM487_04125 [Candidatus Marithrix sp.]
MVILKIVKSQLKFPVTIIGQTIYGHSIHNILPVKSILCKTNSFVRYYNIDGTVKSLEGDLVVENVDRELIPLSAEHIANLEIHTGLTGLSYIQEKILKKYKKNKINYYDLLSDNNCVIHKITPYIFGLYLVKSNRGSWITNHVISDQVDPLRVNEIVTGIVSKKSEQSYLKSEVIQNSYIYELFENGKCVNMTNQELYKMDSNLNLKILNSDDVQFYGLKIPRKFNNTIIHPFHLSHSWDSILSCMIVAYKVILNKLHI